MATVKTSVFSRGNWLRCLIASAALPVVSSAHAAADWSIGPVTDWAANPSNLLYTATISTSSLANLADGKLVEFGNNGNVGNNTVVSWTLSDPSTVYAVNVFTKYSDAGRDGIDVAKLEVKCSGSDEWVDLGADEVEYATLHLDGGNIAHDGHRGSFYAIYKDADNAPLATDVVAFRVTFGPNQDNSKTGRLRCLVLWRFRRLHRTATTHLAQWSRLPSTRRMTSNSSSGLAMFPKPTLPLRHLPLQ